MSDNPRLRRALLWAKLKTANHQNVLVSQPTPDVDVRLWLNDNGRRKLAASFPSGCIHVRLEDELYPYRVTGVLLRDLKPNVRFRDCLTVLEIGKILENKTEKVSAPVWFRKPDGTIIRYFIFWSKNTIFVYQEKPL